MFGLLKFCDPKVGKDAEVERIEKRRKLNDLMKVENKEINSQTKIDDTFSMLVCLPCNLIIAIRRLKQLHEPMLKWWQ